MTDPKLLTALLAKNKRDAAYKKLLDASFPAQVSFITDPAKLKAACCTRRSGKSYGTGIMLVKSALDFPGERNLYLTYTREKAKENLFKPLIAIMERCEIPYEWNGSTQTFTLTGTNSEIILRGLNNEKEFDKIRGDHFPLAIVDECGHGTFNKQLDYLVHEVLEPCVAQHDGSLVLIGTPGNYIHNLFYEVTGPQNKPGWSVHRWTWEQNTTLEKGKGGKPVRVCDAIRKLVQRKIQTDPNIVHTDGYRREWQGEWAIDEEALAYRFNPHINFAPSLPKPLNNYWFVLGTDLGSNDPTAFIVGAFEYTDPTLYIVYAYAESKMDFVDVPNHIKNEIFKRFPKNRFIAFPIDGANKQGVETMKRRAGIPFEATPKAPNYKHDAIRIMNSDFGIGAIKLLPNTDKLVTEYKQIVWDENNPMKTKEGCPDHLADAALYAYLKSRHYLAHIPEEQKLNPTDEPKPLKPLEDDSDDNLFDWLDIERDFL